MYNETKPIERRTCEMVIRTRTLPGGKREEYYEYPHPPAMNQHSIRCTECNRKVNFTPEFYAGKRRGKCKCGITWRIQDNLGNSVIYGTRITGSKRDKIRQVRKTFRKNGSSRS